MRLTTAATPGTAHAAASASSRSASDRATPDKVTLWSCTAIEMRCEFNSALRVNASAIFWLTRLATMSLSITRSSLNPRMPFRYLIASAAARF